MLVVIPQNYRNLWAFYTLTNAAGECFDVGIGRFTDMMHLDGFTHPGGSDVYMAIMDTDEDRQKLLGRAQQLVIERGWRAMEHRLHNIYKRWHKPSHGRARRVMCVDTGQTWNSISACAVAQNVSMTQLSNHLRGIVGYKTVKGNVYRFID